MTFKTTTTKKEQIDYIKKYAFFLIPKDIEFMLFFPFVPYLSFLLIHYLKVVTWFQFSLFLVS